MSYILKQQYNSTWITLINFFIKWMKKFELQHVGNELSSNNLSNILINSCIHLSNSFWNHESIDHYRFFHGCNLVGFHMEMSFLRILKQERSKLMKSISKLYIIHSFTFLFSFYPSRSFNATIWSFTFFSFLSFLSFFFFLFPLHLSFHFFLPFFLFFLCMKPPLPNLNNSHFPFKNTLHSWQGTLIMFGLRFCFQRKTRMYQLWTIF